MTPHEDRNSSREHLRQRIIAHTARTFRAQGIKSVKMDDIARDLQISKRTIYQLFQDKEALLVACIMDDKRRSDRQFAEILSQSANRLEAILRFFKHKMVEVEATSPRFFLDMKNYPQVSERFIQMRETMTEKSVDFLKQGIEEGLFREDIDFDIVYRTTVQISDYAISEAYFDGRIPLIDLYANTVIVYLRGCLTPEGMQVMESIWGS